MYYPPSLEYDAEADVLYINLGSDEMSISEEVDDDIVIDRGYHSGVVTGMRIISPLKKGIIWGTNQSDSYARIPITGTFLRLSTVVHRSAHS